MSKVTEVLCQLAADLETQLNETNELWEDARLDRDEFKQQLDLVNEELSNARATIDELSTSHLAAVNVVAEQKKEIENLQVELKKPQECLQQYRDQIRMLENQINALKNLPPAPVPGDPRDNILKALPGYGEVPVSALLGAGWTRKQTCRLETVELGKLPSFSEWYHSHYEANDPVAAEEAGDDAPAAEEAAEQVELVDIPGVPDDPEQVDIPDW